MSEIKVLTYGVGLDGFYRLAVQLPNINGKHEVSLSGQDMGTNFETNDSIIVCSSIHVENNPSTIIISNGKLSSEKINVRFSTYDFTPNEIYAFLGSVKGSDCENTIILPENIINDYRLIRNGRQNTFIFDFPQGDKKLSDLFDVNKMFTMNQPLLIGLKMESDNYRIVNYEQLSVRNMINNFSGQVKFINANTVRNSSNQVIGGFNFIINDIIGSEDITGMISLDMTIEKNGGFAVANDETLSPSVSVLSNDTKRTNLTFGNKKYNIDNPQGENSFLLDDKYIENYEFDLLSSGSLYIKELDEKYIISTSNSSSGFSSTLVTVNKDLTDSVIRPDGTFREILIADFLPTHCRLHSDRGHISKEIKLNIKEYNKVNGVVQKIEFIPGNDEGQKEFPRGSVIDDGRLFMELIDKFSGVSFIKEIDNLDRKTITTPITSSIFGGYYVDIGFFIYFDDQSEIFWTPIITAPDGTLGIPAALIEEFLVDLKNPLADLDGDGILERNPHNKIYMRLESNRPIQTVTGEISIGNNKITYNTETDNLSKISAKNKSVSWREIDFDLDIESVPENIISLPVKYNLTVYDPNGNPFKLKL